DVKPAAEGAQDFIRCGSDGRPRGSSEAEIVLTACMTRIGVCACRLLHCADRRVATALRGAWHRRIGFENLRPFLWRMTVEGGQTRRRSLLAQVSRVQVRMSAAAPRSRPIIL